MRTGDEMLSFFKGGRDLKKDRMVVPLIPLRDIIIFPYMVVPLFVGREKSIKALELAMGSDKSILLAAQKKATTEEPGSDDIYETGTRGTILQLLRLPDGTVKVLVEGKRRAKIKEDVAEDDCFRGAIDYILKSLFETSSTKPPIVSSPNAFESNVKYNKRV